MAKTADFPYIRFVFAIFCLISLVVVAVEGIKNGVGVQTLAMRAAMIVIGIRIICSITVGVLRGYEEIQGS